LTIQVGEFGELLNEEAVRALELLDDPSQPEQPVVQEAACCMLSAHALAGTESPNALRLPERAANKAVLLLVDSGSSQSFINAQFVSNIHAVQ
jgi:hypothetical protein